MKKAIFAIVASLSMAFAFAQPSDSENMASTSSHAVSSTESSIESSTNAPSTVKTETLPGVTVSKSIGKFFGAVMSGPSKLLDATAAVANDVKQGFKEGIQNAVSADTRLASNERIVSDGATKSESQSEMMAKSSSQTVSPAQQASFNRAKDAFASMFQRPVTAAVNPVAVAE